MYLFKYLQAFVGLFVKTNKVVDKTLWVISTARSAIIIIVATVYVMVTDTKAFGLVGMQIFKFLINNFKF